MRRKRDMSRALNFRRITAIMLVLGLILAAQVFGQTKFGPKTEPLLKTFTSGTYHMKSSMSGGGMTSEMEIFVKGDRIATVISAQGEKNRIIVRDNKTYMINDSQKMIMVSPSGDTSATGAVDTGAMIFTGSGTASFAGKNLPYEEYKTDEGKVQYFVDGNKLAGMRTIIPGQGNMDMVISALDQNVPDSVFTVPSGYEVLDMSGFRF